MKIRLFWIIVFSFILVIVLGIGGMLIFSRLAIANDWPTEFITEEVIETRNQAYAQAFADYYVAHDRSWQGVDQRIHNLLLGGGPAVPHITIVATDGTIIASNEHRWKRDRTLPERFLEYGHPIVVEGQPVGIVIVEDDGPFHKRDDGSPRTFDRDHHREPPPPDIVHAIFRAMLGAGLGLALVLITLAVVTARNLNRPLKQLTSAAQTLASGNLEIQVPGSRVRELNTLSTAFNSMARSLADLDRQRKQMTADVAHELRTPLAVVKGRLEGMQDGVYHPDPEQIARLLNEVAMLERLIEDLRLLALAEAGQLPLHMDAENPRDVLDDAAATFAEQAAAQGVALLVEAPDDLPDMMVDSQRMNQVVNNLVANALRHTPQGGTITLRARGGDPLVIEVADTGSGIAPEDLPHIFERFWRTDRSRTRSSGGSGLGLAIARQIIEAHGGSISAESTPGQGTTMRITLPGGGEQ
jgi:signal transduction histidine kinase